LVILSNVTASPTNQIPGNPGKFFVLGTSSQFDRVHMSPDGTYWMLGAMMEDGSDDKAIIMTGSDMTTATFMTHFVEDAPAFFDSNQSYNTFSSVAAINNNGEFAFSCDLNATSVDEVVIRGSRLGLPTLIAREGSAIPFLSGRNYGGVLDAVGILENGTAYFRIETPSGTPTHDFLVTCDGTTGNALVETAVTKPTDQFFSPTNLMEHLRAERFRMDSSGTTFLYEGDLAGSTGLDTVFVKNNSVLAQEAALVPGSSLITGLNSFSSDNGSLQLSPNGQHYAYRGTVNATSEDFVLSSVGVFETGQPIVPGSSETWSDATGITNTFLGNAVNDWGDIVLVGASSITTTNRNLVFVLNGYEIILRETDPVDFTGDGIGDGFYVANVNIDDMVLTANNDLYFTADLKTTTSQSSGSNQAFMKLRLPLTADLDGDNEVGPGDFAILATAFLSTPGDPNWDVRADIDRDGEVGPGDFSILARNFLRSR